MNNYQLGLYEKSMPDALALDEKLAHAKTARYDFMELSIDESDGRLARLEWTDAEIADLRVAMQQAGLPIRTICLSGHRRFPLGDPDEATRHRGLEIMEKAILLAAQLGVRVIQIAGYDVYYKPGSIETRAFFAENLEKSVLMAAKHGVTLAFETMETEFLNTVEKSMHWVSRLHNPWLQVYPDIGNLTNAAVLYSHDVLADLERGKGHLCALHLKETTPGVFREVPYGTGHVNFEKAVAKAFQLGVRLFVGEFWYTGQQNWQDILAENNQFLRRVLDAAAR